MSPSREGLLRLTRPAASVFQERLFLLLSGVFIAALVASGDVEGIERSLASYRGVWLFVDTVPRC